MSEWTIYNENNASPAAVWGEKKRTSDMFPFPPHSGGTRVSSAVS